MGEALVDLVIPHDDGRSAGDQSTLIAALGGAPFNTARTCGRLGVTVEFVGAVSDDRFGGRLMTQLETDGVDVGAVERVTAPTTLAAAELDERGAASYRFYAQGTSAPSLVSVPPLAGAEVVFTGGLALVLEPMADTIEAAVVDAPDDTLVMVDVNCRPLATADPERYAARVDRVLTRADVVKVSDDDLAWLRPATDPLDAARSLLGYGPAVVLLTCGADGVTIVTDAGEWTVPVAPIPASELRDTIGAGDAFAGGFVSWWVLMRRRRAELRATGADTDLVAAVRAANAVARIVCTRHGADPPWRHELPAGWDSGTPVPR